MAGRATSRGRARAVRPVRRLGPPAREPAAGRRASAATGRASFLLTLIAVVALAAFLSPLLRSFTLRAQEHRPDHPGRTPLYPADPVDVLVPGQGPARSCSSRSTATTRPLALLEPGRKQSTFIDPAAPERRADRLAGLVADARAVWQFAPHWENFGKVWDLIDYPAAAVQHRRDRAHRRRSGRCCRARSWRTASRASSSPAGASCSRC